MILTVSNSLPGHGIQLGTNDDEESYLLILWDSCTAINTVNILMNKWIITQHPNMVEEYEQFDNRDAFEPIKLTFSVDHDAITKTELTCGHNTPHLLH